MKDRLIVALDHEDFNEAKSLVASLDNLVNFYKVGPKLFYRTGPAIIDVLRGKRIFIDLKLHDIPETVAGAIRQLDTLGATFATAHVADGSARAAANEVQRCGLDLQILGVTVLTSTTRRMLVDDGCKLDLDELVLRRARMAMEAGCVGVVCSAKEASLIRTELGSSLVLVTPGIRRDEDAVGDQARVATPRTAITAGADYMVVGRPIIASPDPRATVKAFLEEIESA